MECLRGYIGLKGCGLSDPESGLYINQLAGISLESVAASTDKEQETYVGTWRDIESRGLSRFSSLIQSEMSKRYRLKLIKKGYNLIPKISSDGVLSNKAVSVIDLNHQNDRYYTKSNLRSIYIQHVTINVPDVNNNVTVRVMDFASKEELFNKQLNLHQGINFIPVNKTFAVEKLEINVENLVNVYNSTVPDAARLMEPGVYVKSFTENAGVYTSTLNTYGLGFSYSIVCSFDNLVCLNKATFKNILLYCLGAETMMERLFSKRWNEWTRDREEGEKLMEFYSIEAEKEAKRVCSSITMDLSDQCIECDAPIKSVSMRV